MSTKVQGKTGEFSLWLFVTVMIVSFVLILAVLRLIAPSTFHVQFSASIAAFVVTFLVAHLATAFVEFFFHRYVLHAPVVPFLRYFYKQHTLHHSLTRVRPKGENVENKYPILVEEQHEASFFPWYSMTIFSTLATPLFALGQWLVPDAPIFLGGYSAIAYSLFLYETLHAMEHWSLDKWKPLLDHPKYGGLWRVIYGFHLRHHADIRSNEAISGFLVGIPLPDLVFGTYKKADSLFEDGSAVEKAWFESPRPVFFIHWLDMLAEWSVRRYRARKTKKQALAHLP